MLLKSEAQTRERERESKRLRRFVISFFLIFSLILQNLLFLVTPAYASTNTWDFSTSSNYTYNDTKIEFSSGQAQLKATSNWYNTDWKYRKKITIDHTKVPNTNQTNFPVLVSRIDADWKDIADGGYVGQSDGGDILFTSSDGTTKLNHEIEKYNSSTGNLVAWINIPSLSSTADTDLYMYYGNATTNDQWNINSTWNSNFNMVQHLQEDPSGAMPQILDSTSNHNDGVSGGTMLSEDQVTGQIDGSLNFDGSDDYLEVGNAYTLSEDATKYLAFPDIDILPNGNWIVVYKKGTAHAGDLANASIVYRISTDKSSTWSSESTLSYSPHTANMTWQNVWITTIGTRTFAFIMEDVLDSTTSKTWLRYSDDSALTWSTPIQITSTYLDLRFYEHGDVIETPSGDLLIAGFGKRTGGSTKEIAVLKSSDNGISWSDLSHINIASDLAEPSMTYAPDGTLLLKEALTNILFKSTDSGATWDSGTDIGNTLNSPMFTVKDNIIYLFGRNASNDTLVYISSSNNGTSWSTQTVIDTYQGFYGNGGYCGLIQDENKIIAVYYTNNGANPFIKINKDVLNAHSRNNMGTGDFTIEAWIKTSTTATQSIVEKIDSTKGYVLSVNADGTARFLIDDGNAGNWFKASTAIVNDGIWHYVAGVVDRDASLKIYVDNVAASDTSPKNTGSLDVSDRNLKIGTRDDVSTWKFNGTIDEVRISNVARSADWVASSYNNENSPSTFYTLASQESLYDSNNPTIYPITSTSQAFTLLSGFSETATKNGGQIKYQVSNDSGTTWYWYNSGWTITSSGYTEANTASNINTNISTFPVGSGSFLFKAYLNSNGSQLVQLDSIDLTYSSDDTPPSISLTALSPDPNTDSTPSLTGTATDAVGTVSNVQFQMNATSGSWTACTADDGAFDEASEAFICTVASALSDGSHTIYVRATDSNSNTTANADAATDSFTIDTTAPASLDLDSPGDNSYTNSERPTFKWKATSDATAGLSKYVLEIDNPSLGSGQPSGDFTIDSIPTSRTTDYETNKYIIHYENFSDSDSTNNYISVYTKSHSDWGSSENDGKLREGRVSWKIKAVDGAGNERSSSRTLFVDRTSPSVAFTQINSTPYTTNNFSTTDKTPTLFGKITDSLSGGDSSQTQDENGPKIASAPKEANIKVEKKEGLTYKLVTLYKINMDNPYYTCDPDKTIDNSKQKCDKYLPFEYTPKENLDLGIYKITLAGKDKADNTSSETSFTLNITILAQITTPEEKKIIEEGIKELPKEDQEKVKEELEITKPTETPKPNILEKAGQGIANTSKNIIQGTGNLITTIFTGIGNGISLAFNSISSGLAFVGNAIGNGYNSLANHAPGVSKNTLVAIGTNVNNAINGIRNGIANLAFSIGEKTDDVSHGVGTAIIKIGYLFVPEPTKIANVQVAKSTPTSMTITWDTNHPANGKVNYGLTADYGQDVQSEKRISHHEFTVTGLKPNTTYYYEVMSQNRNYVYDANHTFTTPAK